MHELFSIINCYAHFFPLWKSIVLNYIAFRDMNQCAVIKGLNLHNLHLIDSNSTMEFSKHPCKRWCCFPRCDRVSYGVLCNGDIPRNCVGRGVRVTPPSHHTPARVVTDTARVYSHGGQEVVSLHSRHPVFLSSFYTSSLFSTVQRVRFQYGYRILLEWGTI